MSYIAPNSDIVLCTNVPLENTYDHTLTFASLSAQQTYFASKAYKTITQNSYQRAMKNSLRIACTMDEAVRCNYLYFRNASFENKYFYAFITGWEYVNNITTEITYEIDVFQTFFFDIDIKPSFVEREHSNTDIIGENLVPEGLEQGDYVVMNTSVLTPYNISGVVNSNGCVLFYTTFNDDASCSDFTGDIINYVFTGLNVIKKDTVQEVQTFLNKVQTLATPKIDGIIAAYMCPFSPVDMSVDSVYSWSFTLHKYYDTLAGYTPKNKKLYTAPYLTLRLRNDTDINEFPFEYFNGETCRFEMIGTMIPEPTLTVRPASGAYAEYMTTGTHLPRNDLRQVCKSYPQVSWDSDVFKVYLAQNAGSIAAGMISTVGSHAKEIRRGLRKAEWSGAIDVGIDIATEIASVIGQARDISVKPPQLNGSQTSLSDYAVGAKNFYLDVLSIRPEFAEIIDGYFNMFGYATHKVKVPNVTGRPHWNYVKTKGVVLDVANAPQPYIQKLVDCFNKGITFWHNPSEVGNYNLDNSPV